MNGVSEKSHMNRADERVLDSHLKRILFEHASRYDMISDAAQT
jgi:hypothetical protein